MAHLDELLLYGPPDRLHLCPYDIVSNLTKRKTVVPGTMGHWMKKHRANTQTPPVPPVAPPAPQGRIEVTRMPSEYGLKDGDFELTVIDL